MNPCTFHVLDRPSCKYCYPNRTSHFPAPHTHDCPLPMWERVLINNSREQDELLKDMQALVIKMRSVGLTVECTVTESVVTTL